MSYKVRIKTERYEVEVEGDEKEFVIETLERQLASLSEGPSNISSVASSPLPTVSGKSISLQEFLLKVRPSSGPDYVVAIGFYLEKY